MVPSLAPLRFWPARFNICNQVLHMTCLKPAGLGRQIHTCIGLLQKACGGNALMFLGYYVIDFAL